MKRITLACSLLLSTLCLAAPLSAAEGGVATVNGAAIAQDEFDRQWKPFMQRLGIPGDHSDKSGKVNQFRKDLLDKLIEYELLSQEATRKGFAATDAQVEEEFTKVRGRFPNAEVFGQTLTAQGWTEASLRTSIRRTLGIQTFIQKEIADTVAIGDDDIKTFYDGNKEAFTNEEMVQARHILVTPDAAAMAAAEAAAQTDPKADEATKAAATKKSGELAAAAKAAARTKAEGLLAKLKGGADFAALAKEGSDCPSKDEGGDLGLFPRGQMVKAFEDVAFTLKPGEMSGLVESEFGFHIIKVEAHKPASVAPMSEVTDNIREYLKGQKVNTLIEERAKALRAAAKVEILMPLD